MGVLITILIIITVILGAIAIIFMVAAFDNYLEDDEHDENIEKAIKYWQLNILSISAAIILFIIILIPIVFQNHPYIKLN